MSSPKGVNTRERLPREVGARLAVTLTTMPWDLKPKPASASSVVLARQMEIPDANLAGNVHGGTIMKLVDTAAGLAAAKHCGGRAGPPPKGGKAFLGPG